MTRDTCGCATFAPLCGGHALKYRLRDDDALSMAHLLNAQARALGLPDRAREPAVTVLSADDKPGSSTMARQYEAEHEIAVRGGWEA